MTTTDPRTRLDEIKARADSMAVGNTANPPMVSIAVGADGIRNISAVLDHDLPAMAAALTAVLDVHGPFVWDFGQGPVESCRGCSDMGAVDHDYPCPTVRAIIDALGGDRG